MQDYYHQINFNQDPPKKNWVGIASLFLLGAGIAYLSLWLGIKTNTIEISNDNNPNFWAKVAGIITFSNNQNQPEEIDLNYIVPTKENDRIDILILGIRGDNDPNAEDSGPYLTDTIIIFSYDKTTGKSSVVSIPRDLYVKVFKKQEKLNAAYAEALARKQGLGYVEKLISQITGVYIDHAIVIDFSSFEKIIDELGGINITLDKSFDERTQWGYEFHLSAGLNHLNGQDALYYARSRYSTNDFDRAKRQQQIILALKNELLKINFFSDPVKTISIFNTIRSNIQTDIGLTEIRGLVSLVTNMNGQTKHEVISIENLLHETIINDSYVLLPNGDNFNGIKQLFQNILK